MGASQEITLLLFFACTLVVAFTVVFTAEGFVVSTILIVVVFR
jgi:general stress protein CsbA